MTSKRLILYLEEKKNREKAKNIHKHLKNVTRESLHTEAYNLPLEIGGMNELGLRFLYKLRSINAYTESLNTLGNREDQNYVGNERTTKPTGIHLRKLEQSYMKKQREVEEKHQAH